MEEKLVIDKTNYEKANIFSKLSFWWAQKLVKLGMIPDDLNVYRRL